MPGARPSAGPGLTSPPPPPYDAPYAGDSPIASRLLIPKEHGAYGQLLIPLVCALLVGRPAAGAWLLAGAATAAFFAHEGVLVLLGQRGPRAAREQHAEARQSVALFGGFAVVSGLVALTTLPAPALYWLALPVTLAALVGVAVFTHLERTTAGEVLVAAALSSVAVPVAVAGGTGSVAALTLLAVFATVFVSATISVRAMIGRVTKAGGPPPALAAACTVLLLVLLGILSVSGRLASVAPFAASPVSAVALALAVRPPAPRYLRQIGWTLVGTTVLSALMLVAGLA
ncbi:MAG: YwiC-like family protein [Vicinamibacterales bacterium]